MRQITQQEIVLAIKDIVERNPYFCYPEDWTLVDAGCMYFRKNGPACLIGHYIASTSFTYERLVEGVCASEALKRIGQENEVFFSGPALAFADLVQCYQDSGMPWMEAFTAAVRDGVELGGTAND